MAEGRIVKGIGGFYYVRTDDGHVYECRAKGKFRLKNVIPLIGDRVDFALPSKTAMGVVEKILPRKNLLPRPAVANIDMLVIIVSADKPEPDLLMVDKLILYGKYYALDIVLAINKTDIGVDTISNQYQQSDVSLLKISAKTGEGMELLKRLMTNKCTCLAGQSAVGKSSVINYLMGTHMMDVGTLSAKTGRGTHTTRHSELFCIPDGNGTVIDTPGFSVLQAIDIAPQELGLFYDEFSQISCRFHGCLHKNEPGCGVKQQAAQNPDFNERYQRYLKILEELTERKEKEYD